MGNHPPLSGHDAARRSGGQPDGCHHRHPKRQDHGKRGPRGYDAAKKVKGRKRRPSAGILATQSVRTGPRRGPRGYDAAKKVKGRKRVLLLTGTEGLIHAIRVVPASVQDRDTPAAIEPELAGSSLLKVWADLASNGDAAAAPMIRCGIDLESSWSGGGARPGSRSNPSDGGSSRPSGFLAATGGS